jgi:tripartite-type tricarboxylate transporter receptor subunit TctC
MQGVFALVAALLLCGMSIRDVRAQAYPSKPVRIIIGVPSGGLSDVLARHVAAGLSTAWGQQVLVESRPGASDVIAAEAVKNAPADGYTLYQANDTILVVNSLLRKNLPFNPMTDFAPVRGIIQIRSLLVARRDLPANTVAELVALARQKPLSFGTFGIGSASHFDAEKFSLEAGIKMMHVPYKGGTDVPRGMLAGEFDIGILSPATYVPLIKAGKVKALAWGGTRRHVALPDVPTFDEAGLQFATGGWFGLFAKAGTPAPIVERVSTEVARVLATPAVEKYVSGIDAEIMNISSVQLEQLLKDTRVRYQTLLKTIDLKLD